MRGARTGVAIVGLLALAATGCASRNSEVDSLSATYGMPSTRVDLEAESWVLQRARSSLTVSDGNPVTIAFDDARVSGTGPCNIYRGGLDLDGDSIEISGVSATARSCSPSIEEAEREYFAALEAVNSVDVSEHDLVLTGPRGVRLAFDAYDARERIIGRWPVVNVATSSALEGVLAGSNPSVTFANNGAVTLVTGCNTGRGDWTLEGDRLTIDPFRQTRKLCTQPDGVMDQESSLTQALESAARVEVTPGKLTILNGRGSIALIAVK
jgi:heat shock protein HslJ